MRIGKPLLAVTTTTGLALGIYEAFHLSARMGVMLVVFLLLFGGGIAWVVAVARAESKRGDRPG